MKNIFENKTTSESKRDKFLNSDEGSVLAAEAAYELIKQTILLNPANRNLDKKELHKLIMEELNEARNDDGK